MSTSQKTADRMQMLDCELLGSLPFRYVWLLSNIQARSFARLFIVYVIRIMTAVFFFKLFPLIVSPTLEGIAVHIAITYSNECFSDQHNHGRDIAGI